MSRELPPDVANFGLSGNGWCIGASGASMYGREEAEIEPEQPQEPGEGTQIFQEQRGSSEERSVASISRYASFSF